MKKATTALDRTDYRIIEALVEDGRVTDIALGEKLHLSSTAIARRRRILEDEGIIQKYSAQLDLKALDLSIMVIVQIELSSQAEHVLEEFERSVAKSPSMSFCSFVSGDTDFIMILHVASFETYDKIYRKELSALPHVSRIRSSFVMREVAGRTIPRAALAPALSGSPI